MLEGTREIPIVGEADVVVIGGGCGAVAAAIAARQTGASVWLIAPYTYLGEDLCATLRLFSDAPETPGTDLARRLFPENAPVTPMHIKRTLDESLLDSGIEFVFGSRVSDLILDDKARPAGVVIANRCGRQAVTGKHIIDASEHAVVARMAGAGFTAYPSGVHDFTRIVVGGEPVCGKGGITHRFLERTVVDDQGTEHPVIEYSVPIAMRDGSWADLAEAEQTARDRTFHPGQLDASEKLFEVSPRHQFGCARVENWPGAEDLDLAVFEPDGTIGHLHVLGDQADLSRQAARELLRPDAIITCGERLGHLAAESAERREIIGDIHVAGNRYDTDFADSRELLNGLRPTAQHLNRVSTWTKDLPILAETDVLVVGAGTAGAPAALNAAREGARTLVIEPLHEIGGVMTAGLIGRYYHGYRGGFTAQIDAGVREIGAKVDTVGKAEWLRRQMRQAGADIRMGVTACGAEVRHDTVTGVVVITPHGRGLIRAHTIIDSTGNADVAAAAGARCMYINDENAGLQGSGLPPRNLGKSYTNTDYTFADDGDLVDAWRMFVVGRQRFADAYDFGQLLDTRERRRIVPELMLDPVDHINHRTFPDTIMIGRSNFDSHGFTVHPYFLLNPPDRSELTVDVPLRTLLPLDLRGIIVTGLAAGGHRDAMPIIRMQPCLQNQGCAVGLLAAAAARQTVDVRDVDLRAIQKRLIDMWCLPKRVLTDSDSYPFSKAELREAVRTVPDNWDGLAKLMTDIDTTVGLLHDALGEIDPKDENGAEKALTYAHILGMLGDVAGANILAEAVAAAEWDEGWNYRGMGQFGPSMSTLDSRIVALGRTGASRAVDVLVEKIRQLGPDHALSHHRAVALAAEALAASDLAPPLADLLNKPDMTGHSLDKSRVNKEFTDTDPCSNFPRTLCLRELILARALYRCGDRDNLAEQILRRYQTDIRGLYARHADAVLQGFPPNRTTHDNEG